MTIVYDMQWAQWLFCLLAVSLIYVVTKECTGAGSLKAVGITTSLIVFALVVSLSDCHGSCDRDDYPCNCDRFLAGIDRIDGDPVLIYVTVADTVIENGTDFNCTMTGRCIQKLILDERRASGKEALVVITNTGWIPSKYRVIDAQWAAVLADEDIADDEYDLEEIAHANVGASYERGDD